VETGLKPPGVGLKIVIYTLLALSSRSCLAFEIAVSSKGGQYIYMYVYVYIHVQIASGGGTVPKKGVCCYYRHMHKVIIVWSFHGQANTALASGIK